MSKLETIVVAGGGLAGANAAFALRELGFDGDVVLVGEEKTPPYERPPLSKAYLRGEEPFEKALVRPLEEYERQQISLVLDGRATSIEPRAGRLALDSGADLGYDALVIATGAQLRRLNVPGEGLNGIHYLRSLGDADAIKERAASAQNIAVIGGGWIGSEVAASLRQTGRRVTLVTARPRPLEHVVGTEVAEAYRRMHADNGVKLVQGRVAAFHGSPDVDGLELADGSRLPTDMVVVGVGASPRSELSLSAGLELDGNAIAVDEQLRTSVPNIFAVGDVASAWHPRFRRRIRVEHWDNAIQQGRTAAANLLGAGLPYERTPYLYSDQFDLGMEYRGFAPRWDDVIIRGDLERREFIAFWLASGRVVAAMNANLWDEGEALQRLVESQSPADVAALRDEAVPLGRAA